MHNLLYILVDRVICRRYPTHKDAKDKADKLVQRLSSLYRVVSDDMGDYLLYDRQSGAVVGSVDVFAE